MESDDEVKGDKGTSYTAEFWQYDPRVSKRWNIDPVIKHHESPYAAIANNPIWFVDPTGADSTLAAGSNIWKWTVEKGDTYNEVSSRTGVPVEDLRYFNQDIVTADHKIPTGAVLNISDPSCSAPNNCSDIINGEGTIQVLNYRQRGANSLGVVFEFTPDQENIGNEYVWFQTFKTNDPKRSADDFTPDELGDRRLLDKAVYGNDQAAGVRMFRSQTGGMYFRHSGVIVRPSNDDIGFLDQPSRSPINNGTILWDANLTLLKKVDGKWINVSTIQYGYTMNKNFSPKPLRVNPEVDPSDKEFHNKTVNSSTDILLR